MAWQQLKKIEKHNYAIDMLRFFAALIVVLFHLNQAIAPVDNWYRNLVKYGWLGVPMFFVISGYCIIISAYNSINVKDFLIRRFFRIFPPYWISLIIVGIAAIFQKLYIGTNAVHFLPKSLPALLATLTLTTSPITNYNTINWVYWTLSCEVLFYMTICITLLFNKKLIVYLLIIISLISAVMPSENHGLLFFLDQWPAFGLGFCIYYFFKASDKISWLCFGALLIINVFSLLHKFIHNTEYIVFSLVTFGLILASNYIKLSKNIFSKLGQYSYSVYLIHVPIGVFILGLFESDYIKQRPLTNFMYDLTVYAFISIIAWLMFKYVEKPSIAYGRKIAGEYIGGSLKKHAG